RRDRAGAQRQPLVLSHSRRARRDTHTAVERRAGTDARAAGAGCRPRRRRRAAVRTRRRDRRAAQGAAALHGRRAGRHAMRRWLPHPLLSVSLVVLWLLLVNEFSTGHLVLGALLGWLIPFATSRFWPEQIRIRHPGVLLRFLGV